MFTIDDETLACYFGPSAARHRRAGRPFDAAVAEAMKDSRMQVTDDDEIFDGRRLIASGFITIVEL